MYLHYLDLQAEILPVYLEYAMLHPPFLRILCHHSFQTMSRVVHPTDYRHNTAPLNRVDTQQLPYMYNLHEESYILMYIFYFVIVIITHSP